MSTHDYTVPRWGHDVVISTVADGGQRLEVSGWGRGIVAGDLLVLAHAEVPGGSSRYVVEKIKYYEDPPDMFAAMLAFAPRLGGVPS